MENLRVINNMTSINATSKVLKIGQRKNNDEFKRRKKRKNFKTETIQLKKTKSEGHRYEKQPDWYTPKIKRTSLNKRVIDIKV